MKKDIIKYLNTMISNTGMYTEEMIKHLNGNDPFFKIIEITPELSARSRNNEFAVMKDKGVESLCYLQNDALKDHVNGDSKTFVILDKDTNEFAGYFTIKIDYRSMDMFDGKPLIQLLHFCVNKLYVKNARTVFMNLGVVLFENFVTQIMYTTAIETNAAGYFCVAPNSKSLIELYGNRLLKKAPGFLAFKLKKRIPIPHDKKHVILFNTI